jgi:solute:Na+ symporter, SSS family
MALRWPDAAVIAAYLAAMILIGRRFARRQTTTEVYFVAGRSIPHWAMGISIYAALISSITFTGYPGAAYSGDWSGLVPGFMVIGVLALAGLVIIPFFRHAVGMSAYEYFERRFSPSVRLYSAFAFTAGHFSKLGFVFFTLALTIASVTGWNVYAVLLVAGAVTLYYTVSGGFEAVIWLDVVQGGVKAAGLLACLVFLLRVMPGGPAAAFHLAWAHHKFSLGRTDFDLTRKGSIWVMSLYGFFWYLQKYAADQTLVQRYLVARSDREALKGVALGALLCVPAWALFLLVGTLIWAFYRLSPGAPPAFADPDKIFPYFLATRVPEGLAGLFLAALLSAAMSMLSSDLNCLAAVCVEDYYRKLRPGADDARRLRAGKRIAAACGILSVGIAALLAWKSARVLSFYFAVASVVAGGLAGLFLLAFLCPRANRQGACVGIVACLAFTAWGLADGGRWLHPIMVGVAAHLVLLGVGYAASFCFPPPDAAARQMTLWGWLRRPAPALSP